MVLLLGARAGGTGQYGSAGVYFLRNLDCNGFEQRLYDCVGDQAYALGCSRPADATCLPGD